MEKIKLILTVILVLGLGTVMCLGILAAIFVTFESIVGFESAGYITILTGILVSLGLLVREIKELK